MRDVTIPGSVPDLYGTERQNRAVFDRRPGCEGVKRPCFWGSVQIGNAPHGATVRHPRSRCDLRTGCSADGAADGHRGRADGASVSLAESVCGTRDRLPPTRVPRSRHRVGRAFVTPPPATLPRYYHERRTHLSLDKDAPTPRAVQPPAVGPIVQVPHIGGLHHHYERRAA